MGHQAVPESGLCPTIRVPCSYAGKKGNVVLPAPVQALRLGQQQAGIGNVHGPGVRHPPPGVSRPSAGRSAGSGKQTLVGESWSCFPIRRRRMVSRITRRPSIMAARRNSRAASSSFTWPISRRYRRTGSSDSSAASSARFSSSGSSTLQPVQPFNRRPGPSSGSTGKFEFLFGFRLSGFRQVRSLASSASCPGLRLRNVSGRRRLMRVRREVGLVLRRVIIPLFGVRSVSTAPGQGCAGAWICC